ncbi:spindle pole body component 110-like isoform X2 [Contarinia nasturtii]|uniref:spindle pole body component 110-like isoform X2 n=1 Tax=Contarinia nasturtii TaxID=265458 RepID=UPI0012D47BFA|nr:spindle pole body component 110-like isoform X2 [Contarinia nasturtii]
MNQMESTEPTTMIKQRSNYNVIKSLKEYNRSQTNKIARIEHDTALDHDVDGASLESDLPQLSEPSGIVKTLKKFPIYYEWVQTLIDYNDELVEIIDNIHSKSTMTKATATKSTSLIDFNVSECKNVQSTTSNNLLSAAPNTMNYEQILNQNQKLHDQNDDLKRKIKNLERQNKGLEEAAIEARVLVFEVAERHDMIIKLKNEINDMEQQLKQKDTHIQFKDQIIKELRQQRRTNVSRCAHNLGKTKLDSIDKVVDLIRTVRDISPESSSKICDCNNDSYQEKENQTDDELCQLFDIGHEYARKIESQQTEIDILNAEINKRQVNYDKISKAYAALQQQLESVKAISANSNNVADFQVGKTVGSTVDSATAEEFTTAIADKTHLANLITTLKSELSSTNALLKIKEKDFNDAKEQLKRMKGDHSDANQRVALLEKQCENYRLTIKQLEENLQTHSDTIKRLEENQTFLKSQMAESQEKQQNYQKLMDENRKLESNHKHQLTTIAFLRTALEDHLKTETNKIFMRSTKIGRNKNTAQTSSNGRVVNNVQNTTESNNASSSSRPTTSSLKLPWFK